MKKLLRALLIALVSIATPLHLVGAVALAQLPAYNTSFTTSITYQNIGSTTATLTFNFYSSSTAPPVSVSRTLAAGAGSALFIGALSEVELPVIFAGTTVINADQPLAAVAVQIPNSNTVKNRGLSVVLPAGGSPLYIASVLKNQFRTTTRLAIQNVDTVAADITVRFYNAADPLAEPILMVESNLPPGAGRFYDAGNAADLGGLLPASFNGSAVITAVQHGTTIPGKVLGTTLELQIDGNEVRSVDGLYVTARTLYMPTALCEAFGGQTTAYAVQNTDLTTATDVTVHYSNGLNETKRVEPGAKASFTGCAPVGMPRGFSGAAQITSTTTDLIAIGKVGGGGLSTAFVGEATGAAKLALPYIRWRNDTDYRAGNGQRGFIAIQNIAGTAANNVQVRYLNRNGALVGTHTIPTIPAGGKVNSRPIDAGNTVELVEFGTPAANPGGGFGAAVLVEGEPGSQLVALARIASQVGTGVVAEDYNAVPILGGAVQAHRGGNTNYYAPLVLFNR